ncbi:MAG TPA: 2-C-methyl-D-erythritol 4-phosphate cytidylyltransferase [Rhodocyclaceae bacterium]|nr:2-C-methyl-D-erythritol 4-phosphate cytidylyltransferase [Rhodocyclaceae bacterium]
MRYVAIVPAAGNGSRMGGERPKQYAELVGRPLLWYALETLARVPQIDSVCVVLAADDPWWKQYDWSALAPKLRTLSVGGATRATSVSNSLHALSSELDDDDWILVHDAARACLSVDHVAALIDTLKHDSVGGLLAVPVADTLKRGGAGQRVVSTVPRDDLWHAQTPQMFRYGMLCAALSAKPDATDEAGAIEALGHAPRLVAADATNFKVTYPQDLALAAQILQARR